MDDNKDVDDISDNDNFNLPQIDQLKSDHKKALKELQASFRQAKKALPSINKKNKKIFLEEWEEKERTLKMKHEKELANLLSDVKTTEISIATSVDYDNKKMDENLKTQPISENKKISKAEKRRDKKQTERTARLDNIELYESSEVYETPKFRENRQLEKILESRNLSIFEIAADGNCLFAAISDQLKRRNEFVNVEELRKMTTNFMRENINDFLPFMVNNKGELLSDDEFNTYLYKMQNTPCWGGQEEIKALSMTLQSPIEIIQADGPSIIFGDHFDDNKQMILTFHQHMYRLGQHYNSVICKYSVDNKFNDNI